MLATGAGRLLGADAGFGLAAAGCWFDHFEGLVKCFRVVNQSLVLLWAQMTV